MNTTESNATTAQQSGPSFIGPNPGLIESLAAAKDKFPAGSADRGAIWEAIELLRKLDAQLNASQLQAAGGEDPAAAVGGGSCPRCGTPNHEDGDGITTICACRTNDSPPAGGFVVDENMRLREALQFYADKGHFMIADSDAWDTVSGEPPNFWCDEAGTATMEDGTIAQMALAASPTAQPSEDATGVLLCAEHGINFHKGCAVCEQDIDELAAQPSANPDLCSDCPPVDENDDCRCDPCPRREVYPQPSAKDGVRGELIRGLVSQWRHNAQGCGRGDAHAAGTWRSCARELEAAINQYEGE